MNSDNVHMSFKSFENGFEKGAGYCMASGDTRSEQSNGDGEKYTDKEIVVEEMASGRGKEQDKTSGINDYLNQNLENCQLPFQNAEKQRTSQEANQTYCFDKSKHSFARFSSQNHSRSLTLIENEGKDGSLPML